MTSSLAAQLANIGTLDRDRLQASTSKFRPSFLFPPRQAASLSNEEIHDLAYNGFLALLAQDNRFDRFDGPIFGEKAKVTDRTIITKEENKKLDDILNTLIRLLASKFLLKSAGKVLEWLIRRFRINEFNVDELLRGILPYHETPQFVQMLQIVKLDDGKYKALHAVKTSLQPMPRQHLLTAMTKSHDLFRFIATSVDPYRQQECLFSTLIAFWASSVLAYIERMKKLQPQDMAVILPVILQSIKSEDRDLRLGSYIVLSHLAARTDLSQETASLLAETMLVALRSLTDLDEIEAALTTLAILCEHQDETLPAFSQKAASLSRRVSSVLVGLAERVNIAAFLRALLPAVIQVAQNEPQFAEQLREILASPACPEQITQVAMQTILDSGATSGAIPSSIAQIVESVEQRLPDNVSLLSFASNQTDMRLVKALQTLKAATGGDSRGASSLQSLKHRDAVMRAAAAQHDLQRYVNSRDEAASTKLVLDALADASIEVTAMLFSDTNVPMLRDLCTVSPQEVLQACLTDSSSDLPDEVVRLRLKFLTQVFSVSAPMHLKVRVLTEFLWPHLLASKHSHAKNSAILDILADLDNSTWPMFKDLKKSQLSSEADASSYNAQLVNGISDYFSGLSAHDRIPLDALLSAVLKAKPRQVPTKARTLSLLVLLRLTAKSDETFVSRILAKSLPASAKRTSSTLFGSDTLPSALAHRIWSKPASAKTQLALEATTFFTALHSVVASEAKKPWMWLEDANNLDTSSGRHRALVVQVYANAHSELVPNDVRSRLLETLFTTQVSSDILAFLAGIYTSKQAGSLGLVALHELDAFIKAHPSLNYQVVLPSLLYVLAAGQRSTSQAALRALQSIDSACADAKTDQIYGFDKFYGRHSDALQYLNWQQYRALLQVIVREEASLLIDGTYVQQALFKAVQDQEHERTPLTRQNLLGFVISHAEAWHSIPARIGLFSTVQRLVEEKRTTLFQPFVTECTEKRSTFLSESEKEGTEYWKLVLKGLKARSLSDDAMQLVKQVLNTTGQETLEIALRAEYRRAIQSWMLPAANSAQRLVLYETVLSLIERQDPQDEATSNKALLRACLCYADVVEGSVSSVKDSIARNLAEGQPTKKSKSGRHALHDSELPRLALLLENTDIASLTVTVQLLQTFLALLASLVDISASHLDVDYYLQLTATRSSEIAGTIQEAVDENDLRIGPVLETIRISGNPATSNAALNLMADLARIAPAQVAQNVMPIFTFMGTNVLQRDDAQSTRIVDKTLRTIVPALVKHRRERASSKEQLLASLEEVLRVFVDAATHVPRHRRLHLFIRFVDILGPEDFLAPVCTLMVDKAALKYAKTRDAALISLPLGVYQHFSGTLQLNSVHDQVLDIQRKTELLNTDTAEGSISSRHSSPVTPAESPMLPVKSSRRTVLAMLLFLQEVLSSRKLSVELQRARSVSDVSVEPKLLAIITASTALMRMKAQRLSQADLLQLSSSSQALIRSVSRLMTTREFASALEALIQDGHSEISDLGIDLLVERLASIKAAHRQVLSVAVTNALKILSQVFAKEETKSRRLQALLRIRALVPYCTENELPHLYTALSAVLKLAEASTSATFCHQTLVLVAEALPTLGGRVIPAVHRILSLASTLIRRYLPSLAMSNSRNTAVAAFSAVDMLLQTSPTFVAKEVKPILALCVSVDSSGSEASENVEPVKSAANRVISTCTKKLPAPALYQAIQELFKEYAAARDPAASGIVSIFAQTIRQTNTRAVADMHKSLFGQLIIMLDVRSTLAAADKLVNEIEKAAIAAFMQLILKLNEVTFRPLFMRLVDWTSTEAAEASEASHSARQLTFFKIMDRMLVQLKNIAIPYYGLALDATIDALEGSDEEKLWQIAMSALRRALDLDDASFWSDARLSKLVEPLVKQGRQAFLSQAAQLELYQATIQSLANAATAHFPVLQNLHQGLLRLARTDDESVQLSAIRALQAMWDSEAAPELISFKPESMPTIAELLEAGGQVEHETRQLLATMADGEEDAEMALDEDSDEDGSAGGEEAEDED